ncbi:hypothetical protein GOBAR_AA39077 [Gossypium barbadense]|uniref:Uncharacterized protein n=1 Tax=Gossypium barbadense TaxID=3634 RepID=A0A2P5VS64_GOSBA|nr:hypothetical protein GOBAR_AA39077 [Gossypium barbadense]
MESLAVNIVPFPHPSFLNSKLPINREKGFFHCWPCKQRSSSSSPHNPTRLNCHKMFVPGFGEASPEAKAAKNLHNFFNYIAVKIVSAQLESYNPEAYEELMEFLDTHSLNDGDEFCASLMRESSRHKALVLPLKMKPASDPMLDLSLPIRYQIGHITDGIIPGYPVLVYQNL